MKLSAKELEAGDLLIIDSFRAACPRGISKRLEQLSEKTGAAFVLLQHVGKPRKETE